jgi:transposase
MPSPRTPLGVIDSNIKKRKELSPYSRGKVIGARLIGGTLGQIANALNLPKSTVQTTLFLDQLRNHGQSLPRNGAPRAYTDRDERKILRYVRNNPKTKYAKVKEECGVIISTRTIKRILRDNGILSWRAKRRPALTPEVAAKRLEWAKFRKDWPAERFYNIMWSDECSAERGSGKENEWCFGILTQKWNKDFVQTYGKSRDISVMVWACFWWEDGHIRRSDLYIMDRDFESKKSGYSARSYIEVLDDQIPKCWQPGLVFMQDNAPIHKARTVCRWFEDLAIPLLDWPPYSPDLNPI